MRFYKYLFFIIILVSSCDRFVEIESPTILSPDQFFKNKVDMEAGINGMYSGLRNYFNGFYQVSEIPSDNTEANGYNDNVSVMDQLRFSPSTSYIQNLWTNSYSVIASANIILDKINGVDLTEEEIVQFSGEAKFVRALIYFHLVQFFGDVPIVLNEIRSEDQAYSYLREPVDKVYDQIEKDLKEAIASLPESYSITATGKPTKWAALGLLGKVYVTQKKFIAAITVLEEVISAEKHKLLADYEDVFSVMNELNDEMIFSVQYLGGSGFREGSNFSMIFAPFGSGEEITTGGSPSGANSGTFDLFIAFDNDDKRRQVAIELYPNSDSLYYTRKFLDNPVSSNEGRNNWPVLRYADVLLLYAEALNENGNTNKAFEPINLVRTRAGLTPLSINLNPNELSAAIQKERRLELCFEGHRWFDLLRTNTMISTMKAYKENYEGQEYGVQYYEISEFKKLFPIPFREISLNPNIDQNPGY